MSIKCDVLVVGGGPAGAVASLNLAKKNIDVVLVEKNSNIGSHTNVKIDVTPQDTIDNIIKELKLKHNGIGKKSVWYSPNGKKFLMESEVGEYYFKRGSDEDSFEKITINSALDYNCNLVNNVNIKDMRKEKETYITNLDNGQKIKSKYLIGADGNNSIVRNIFLGISVGKELFAYGISSYDFDIDHGTSSVFFDADMIPGGYIYLVKGNTGLSSAGIVLDPSKINQKPEKIFEKFFQNNKEFGNKIKGEKITKFCGMGCIGVLNNLQVEKLFFVGDAGRLASPLFGYGMKAAILSGYLASNTIINSINTSYKNIENYDKNCKELLKLQLSKSIAKSWERLENNDLDLLFNIFRKVYEKNGHLSVIEKLKIYNLIRKNDKYKDLKNILDSFEEMA